MEMLNQLGGLFLAAIPTVIIVFLFYLFMRAAFFKPIMHVMEERKRRIEGSRHGAEELLRETQERQKAYQDAIRAARAQIFTEQEAARRAALDERTATVQQARNRANEEIQKAKQGIAAEIEAARGELEISSEKLAEEIARTILEPEQQLTTRPAGKV